MGSSSSALNFGAGPAKLPKEVLSEVQSELLCYQNCGMSIMEMSHRGKEYDKINNDAQKTIRELLKVPDNYRVLFMQGGGLGGFAAIAMNLINRTGSADYAVTGTWSAAAAKEAAKYGTVNLVFPKADKPGAIPNESAWTRNPDASYLYYCDNETVDGVEFHTVPQTHPDVPLVADMSSSIMTKKVDVSKFGCIFGGAQKNIGPAGVVFVIIREDLLGKPMKICPAIMDFTNINKANSVHNTPATFSVYVMEKVLQWIKKMGGVEGMEKQSEEKSKLLYDAINNSDGFYTSPIDKEVQSRINIPFRIGRPNGNEELEKKFLDEAEKQYMYQLKGHRSVGGIRASLYNAVSLADVKSLVELMQRFKKENDK
ncbi:unnamed protein product [Brassicogethes aeneus]|uniref:phosphoserine transaminase n=1 Tax=Brassicogethes aeneus TaxID=1431903 RepID=A0A9P0BB86_BRAAE|nr:unnamed protein product [Brassicogethes aeneus]